MKKIMKIACGLVAAAALSACAGAPVETTRNAPTTLQSGQLASSAVPTSFNIQSVQVDVPRSLTVSERNLIFPGGDIVWREDPRGDRYAQVQSIVSNAMIQGVRGVTPGTVPALLHVEVSRFHALSEKARYTTGGIHNIQFTISLRDPATGALYGEPKFVVSKLEAYGGNRALKAEQAGLTQKVRITNHLIEVIRAELTQPEGVVAKNLHVTASGQI